MDGQTDVKVEVVTVAAPLQAAATIWKLRFLPYYYHIKSAWKTILAWNLRWAATNLERPAVAQLRYFDKLKVFIFQANIIVNKDVT